MAVFEQSIWATVEGLYIQNTPTTWFHLAREHDVNIEEKNESKRTAMKIFRAFSCCFYSAAAYLSGNFSKLDTFSIACLGVWVQRPHVLDICVKIGAPIVAKSRGTKWLVYKSALRFWIVNLRNSPKIAQESAGFRTPQSAAVPWAFWFGWPAEQTCRKPCNG